MPGFKVALDQLVGKQKMPRQAVVLGAGGGARAVVYGLITEGFQRIVVFNRHLHRAEGLVKHFGRSAAHMELRAMPWHESIIEAELAKTQRPRQRHLDRPDQRRERRSRPRSSTATCSCSTSSTPRPALLRDAAAAGATVADGELMLLHQGAAAFTLWTGQPAPLELMQAKLAEARAGGLRSAEGEPSGAAADDAPRPDNGPTDDTDAPTAASRRPPAPPTDRRPSDADRDRWAPSDS